jgi:phytoene desaturase
MAERNKHIVIIGAGIAGLAAAGLLSRVGFKVTVLEALPNVGGRAGSWQKDGFRFDTGPSWYLMPEVFDHFFELMGTKTSDELSLELLDPGYRVFFEPKTGKASNVDIQVGKEKNLAVFEKIEPGSTKALEKYLDSATETYEIAKKYFLYSSFQKPLTLLQPEVIRNFGRLVRLLTTNIWKFASGFVHSNEAKQILGYPAVFLGTSPFKAPAMFHLMSHLDLIDGVLYPKGGFHELINVIDRLAKKNGATILTRAKVTAINVATGPKAKVKSVEYFDAKGDKQEIEADLVVSAADLHLTETKLLPKKHQTFPESWWKNKTPSPGAVLVYLGVKGELPELLHHSLFFTSDWEKNFSAIFDNKKNVPNPASFYVCTPSKTDDTVAPSGFSNVFILVPVPADEQMGRGGEAATGDEAIERVANQAIDHIAEWAGIPDLRERIVLRKTVGPTDFHEDLGAWSGNSLGPAHTLSQSAIFRAHNKSRKVDGLYYVGSGTIPGIGLPMCLISAEVLLKTLGEDFSTGPLDALKQEE